MSKYFFEKWLNITKNDRILDIGCRDGSTVNYLNKNNPSIAFGLDIDKKSVLSHGFKNLICGDALNLPFKDNSFTKVICSEVLEHVKNDNLMLSNIRCILKKSGKLYLTTPREIKFFDFWDPAYIKLHLFDKKSIHMHYSISKLRKKIKENGFKILKTEVLYSYEWLFLRWVNVVLKYFFKSKKQIVFEGKKEKGKFDIMILAEKM